MRNKLYSFDEHLDEKYGKKGTSKRDSFEKRANEFILNEMLKQTRIEAGITQEQLAKQIHSNKTYISKIENHSQNFRLSTLYKYASALGKKLEIRLV